jgi:uncharacterized protein YkwD
MARAGRRGIALALVAVMLTAATLTLAAQRAAAESSSAKSTPARVTVVADFGARLTASINGVRKSHGLRRLRLVPALMHSACSHSLQMASRGFFSHFSANGTSFFARVKSYFRVRGARYFSAGENLLWATPGITARRVVARWLASPAHRAVLLSPQWTVLGVGVVLTKHGPGVYRGRNVVLVTADFAVRR